MSKTEEKKAVKVEKKAEPEPKPEPTEEAKVAKAVKQLTGVVPDAPLAKPDRAAVEAALEYLVTRADTYQGREDAVKVIREALGMAQ